MEYAMRKIIIGVIFLFLIKSPLISAYTLPLEADMLVFLPDRVGEYMVSDPYGMGMFVDNPNTNPMYNNARYAFRTYVKDDKEIFASIVASTVITGDETTEGIDCDYNTESISTKIGLTSTTLYRLSANLFGCIRLIYTFRFTETSLLTVSQGHKVIFIPFTTAKRKENTPFTIKSISTKIGLTSSALYRLTTHWFRFSKNSWRDEQTTGNDDRDRQ